jgi:hypothetical protein
MYPQLNVYLDDSDTPTVIEPLTVDFDVAETLYGNTKTTDAGLRLVIAYCHTEGKEPKTLGEVRTWARNRKARIMVGDTANPTQREASADS